MEDRSYYVYGNAIILKKYEPNCLFCGKNKELTVFSDKLICDKCISKISDIKEFKK